MLTEADMIRILAEKYSLADSVVEEYVDDEPQDVTGDDSIYPRSHYDISIISDLTD